MAIHLHRAKAMYVDGYTAMTPEMLKLRPVILAKKKERPLFVQPHLFKDGDEVRTAHVSACWLVTRRWRGASLLIGFLSLQCRSR